jgi:phosphate transport system permease protein
LGRALAVLAIAIAAFYAILLVSLLARGGWRVVAFTSFATPLSDVAGEDLMRFVLAAAIFAALAWSAGAVTRSGLERVRGRASKRADRIAHLATLGVAVVGAAAFRDHLPRFLISLPSDTRIGGGIGPEIFNTLYFALLTTLVTLPIGVGAAVYMARFALVLSIGRVFAESAPLIMTAGTTISCGTAYSLNPFRGG